MQNVIAFDKLQNLFAFGLCKGGAALIRAVVSFAAFHRNCFKPLQLFVQACKVLYCACTLHLAVALILWSVGFVAAPTPS